MKTILLCFAILTIVATIGMVSATTICATVENTYISGIITDQSTGDPINGADVTVTCNGNEKTTTSAADGSYSVDYTPGECDSGDTVNVSATYGGLSGSEEETVTEEINEIVGDCLEVIVNVACVDVPLIPEFGVFVGILTIMSAVGVFFVIRKK